MKFVGLTQMHSNETVMVNFSNVTYYVGDEKGPTNIYFGNGITLRVMESPYEIENRISDL